ncbi:MAG: DUF5666 domain-containing protein [Patescibacteria group bacterium]|nr:DUF5666 domain-containing protein [Patescibacteria group bacterium]
MKNKMLIGFIAALVIVGAGSFYGGLLYGKSKSGAQNFSVQERQKRFGQMSQGQAGGGNRVAGGLPAQAGGFVNGNVIAKDDKSITIKLGDSGSKIILLSSSTQITKSVDGALSDLEVGKNVMVAGSANSDGSLTAQSIQLRPAATANATSTPKQ